MKWVRWLLGLCNHKWKVRDQFNMTVRNHAGIKTAVGVRYIQECEHCGKLKETLIV